MVKLDFVPPSPRDITSPIYRNTAICSNLTLDSEVILCHSPPMYSNMPVGGRESR